MTSPEKVTFKIDNSVACIEINRPEKRNALDIECWDLLSEFFKKARDNSDVKAIVLSGAGPSFCAGADLTPGVDPGELLAWERQFSRRYDFQSLLWTLPKPIVAAVQGAAVGRGLELALWCDFVIASDDARLGHPEIREGWYIHSMVPWLANPQQAKLLMMTGELIGAKQALEIGLITRVVEAGGARDEAHRIARVLSHVPPVAARMVKASVNAVYEHMGVCAQQAAGITQSALVSGLSPKEKGVEDILAVRKEHGLKASIEYRDSKYR